MRIDIDGSALSAALADGAYERRATTLPILAHALLEAEGDSLKITTTDLEATCVATIPAKVHEAGRICAEGELLKAAARSGTLRPNWRRFRFTAAGVAPGSGGTLIGSQSRCSSAVGKSFAAIAGTRSLLPTQLAMAIKAVSYAADSAEARVFCTGTWLIDQAVAATDGKRLALFPIDYTGPKVLIPGRQIAALLLLLGSEGAEAALGMSHGSARMIRVQAAGQSCSVRLIESGAPGFRDVMGVPRDSVAALFNRAKLLEAAKQFLPFSLQNGTSRIHNVILSASGGAAQLTDNAGEHSENCNWALKSVDGTFTFRHELKYLIDALAALRCDVVRCTTGAENGGGKIILQPAELDAPEELHVIMGLRA